MPEPKPITLSTPLGEFRGVGPERVELLARLGLRTVHELLLHRPRRYEDRRQFKTIAELVKGEAATTHGKIVAMGVKRWKLGTRARFEFILEDGTARLHCRWWNQVFMENYFHVGDEVLVFGKVLDDRPRTIDHPETEVLESGEEVMIHLNRVTPVYALTEGLPQRWLRGLMWRVLAATEGLITEPHPELAKELAHFPTRALALRSLHFPKELADAERARQRLALDELTELQVAIQRRRRNLESHGKALACGGDNRWIKPFLAKLGFPLTAAQTRVLRELRHDLAGAVPMRRLLQGDVGSGKTVVAACLALMALESGFDVAIMAPTEILVGQHFRRFEEWFRPLGIPVHLHTGAVKTAAGQGRGGNGVAVPVSAATTGRAAAGAVLGAAALPALFVGTHALIEAGFAPERLGLVVIDEQHKFGVVHRERLVRKGRYPHLLVMTATPIPRTLGLTWYGDLDISVLDQIPAGRGRIRTFVRPPDRLPKVWEFLRAKLAEGRQAYVVYPRVEEADDTAGIKAATKEFEKLAAVFAPAKVGLLHGRLARDEQDRVMSAFRVGEIQVLLATAVVEVGVDVANATVMVIENANQFGLAQLHQLRGRVGRGAHESQCILVADATTPGAAQRLGILAATSDGFRIAEEDLKLRGPGELLGREQSGAPPLQFGNLATDLTLVEWSRELAGKVLAAAG